MESTEESKVRFYLCSKEHGFNEIVESETYPKMIDRGGEYHGVSAPYKSVEELRVGCKLLDEVCRECGGLVATHYYNRESLITKNMCFSCDLWDDRVKQSKVDSQVVIINHCFYTFKPFVTNKEQYAFLGHASREFKILKDGKEIISNNVWFGGEIPKHFRDKMPDNAKDL